MRYYAHLLLSIIINAVITENSYAQNKLSYGAVIGAGYNFTKLENASPASFSFGLRIEGRLNEKMKFRTGLVLLQTGSREAPEFCLNCGVCYCPTYAEFDFTFISIPLNLRYNLLENEKKRYYISLGVLPYFASISVFRGGNPEPLESERPAIGKSNVNVYLYHRLLNINLSPGVEFTINEKAVLQIELEIRYALMYIGSGADDMFAAMVTISIIHL